jgi:riboflavin kinase/FMN adenylyltransferase
MQIVRDYTYVRLEDRGAAVAIGNFDGVHLGHVSVLDLARENATRLGAKVGVMTFEPHPREYFSPNAPAFRLMNAEARSSRLEKVGVDILYELNFNAALSSLTAQEFIKSVLVEGLGVSDVIVGADFCFGKGRAGDVALLRESSKKYGFDVTIAPIVADAKGEFSSTNIRLALTEGRPQDAAHMLGHLHRIEGPVVPGDQRGRELGFPTANMSIDGLHPPKYGVYAVLIDILSGPYTGQYQGAASLGERPTFGVNIPNLETFIFDFSGDIYGAEISVALVEFQRPELKFDSLDALIVQMRDDCEQSKTILADYTR